MRVCFGGLFLLLSLVFKPFPVLAYTDDIRAEIGEVWLAAKKVMEPAGIKKADEKNWTLQSQWTEDRVVRRNRLLKGLTSQAYRRRYRMKVTLKTLENGDVQVQVSGKYEQKPEQSRDSAPWQKLKPIVEDYDLERQLFIRILIQAGKNRG